jgi:hypothetical protein
MRIFFIQKAWGLFAPSGEYRANLSFLKHFASLEHATSQLCFGMNSDVKCYIKDIETAGCLDDSAKDRFNLVTNNNNTISIEISAFMNIDNIYILVFDGDKFKKTFLPKIYT